MTPASSILTPVSSSDEHFLVELYASTRAEEMALVPWSGEQKRAFLQMQFEAQDQYYRERYPNASFDLIKFDDRPVGRLYVAELADEIRIIDLTFLPAHFNSEIFVALIKEILQKGAQVGKPVRIFLESYDPQIETFVRLGFRKTSEYGLYFLWQCDPASVSANAEA